VILSYTRRHEWTDTELRSYQVTAAQLAAAIDSREQQILLFQRGQQIAVISERQRLARELHDSVTQLIFSITLIAQSLSAAWRRSAEEGESRINRLLELSQTAQVEMRSLLAELRASEFDASDLPMPTLDISRVRRDGLAAALKDYAASQTHEGLSIVVDAYQYPLQEHSIHLQSCEEALYRIAQEALSNAIRHSEAQHIEIRVGVARKHLFMIVSDDGQGFSLEDAKARRTASSGLGLNTMRERAAALGGTLEMIAAPGEGTTIHVRLPQEE
jgi:signal transduction histidine kinase